jgi:hypothetical protein
MCKEKKTIIFILFYHLLYHSIYLGRQNKNINTHSRFGNNTIFPLYISLEQRTFNRIGYDMYRYKLDL